MSTGTTSESNKTILTVQEIDICKNLAKLDIKLVSQRAQALLLINDGATQATAAEQTGLSVGQVRYLMIIFRKNGISLFPEKLLNAINDITPTKESADKEEKKDEVKEKKVVKTKSLKNQKSKKKVKKPKKILKKKKKSKKKKAKKKK